MSHIQAVIFDLDDTLLDDTASTQAGLRALLAAHQLEPGDFGAVCQRHTQLIEEIAPRLYQGEITPDQARELRFARLLGELGAVDVDGKTANLLYREAYRTNWQTCPGALDLVQHLQSQGFKLALLTNYVREVQMEKIVQFGLEPYFEAMLFACELPAPKPDARAFLAACAALSVAPAQTLMVGDSLKNDVRGALNAGLQAVWFNRHAPDQAGVPSIHTLVELPAWL